ncbi:hypothetical protein BE21_55935 [Sorangium cellulosum]|uniref:Uncharacterized protein n=1 Tax=Sorangium cellulosum TaxID=56 RepID=A0A150TAT7_SORCE|nr:hypothetical protein BE21_55935 [Sorangium cellulosum]
MLKLALLALRHLARTTSFDLRHCCGAEQERWGYLKRIGELDENTNARVHAAGLDALNEGQVQVGGFGERLLSHVALERIRPVEPILAWSTQSP